jgi:hypothetical protein
LRALGVQAGRLNALLRGALMLVARVVAKSSVLLGVLTVLGALATPAAAQNVAWPAFGPARGLLQLDGFTDTLPDFIGPLDGSAELTIFTEGNHYPVLLPLALDAFPAWCRTTGACQVDTGKILIVTLPQPMIVDMLRNGGIRLGNAVVPVGRDQRVFPDLVMGGAPPLRELARAGLVEPHATVFARHRGLGLLLRRDLAGVTDIASLAGRDARVVLASESEPGARNQYRATLASILGAGATDALLNHEVRTFAGRLGIQHRDMPYALINNLADSGIIFAHLAAFYAAIFPDRLRHVDVPAAAPFGQELALVKTARAATPLTAAFQRFFLETARTAYPAGGFASPQTFSYGAELDLAK